MEGMAGEGSFASPARPHPAGSAGGGTGWIPAASPAGAHSGAGAGALIGAGHQNLVEMDEALFAEIEGDREVRDDGWLRLKVRISAADPAPCCSSRGRVWSRGAGAFHARVVGRVRVGSGHVTLGGVRCQVLHKQATLAAALSILDKGMVTKLTSASGRSLYLVEGSMPVPYGAPTSPGSPPYLSWRKRGATRDQWARRSVPRTAPLLAGDVVTPSRVAPCRISTALCALAQLLSTALCACDTCCA